MQVVSQTNTKNTSPSITQYSYISADSLMALTKYKRSRSVLHMT
jgi:hypothetical protein